MKKRWKKIVVCIFLVCVFAFFLVLIYSVLRESQQENENSVKDYYMEDESEPMGRDYYGVDGSLLWKGRSKSEVEHMTKQEKQEFNEWLETYCSLNYIVPENVLLPEAEGDKRNILSNLCLEYDQCIPYSPDGYCYGTGYDKYTTGLDNYRFLKDCNVTVGMGNDGYLVWLFRNVFGVAPEGLKNPVELYGISEKVSVDELSVGDIALLSNTDGNGNLYGIVCGVVDGHPLISYISNEKTELFSYGCNHICYVKSDYNHYYGNSRPIDFSYFFRLNELDWGK